MALINIQNPSYIKQVLEGEVLREMRELMSGDGTIDLEVRENVNSLFQVIDTIEQVRLHGDPAYQNEQTLKRDAIRDRLIKEYDENSEEIIDRFNSIGLKQNAEGNAPPVVVRAMRLTRDTFDDVADTFGIDRDELLTYLVAPSATPPIVVGPGSNVWQIYKAREFNKKFNVKEEKTNGLLFVTEKDKDA